MSKERLEELLGDLPYTIRHSGELEPLKQFAREQAERMQELEEDYKVRQVEYLEEHIDRLEQQNKRYREVLEFYSKESNYSGYLTAGGWVKTPINDDNGEKARKALEGSE